MVRTEDRSFKHKEFHFSLPFSPDPLILSLANNEGFSSLDDNLLVSDLVAKVKELSEGKEFHTFSFGILLNPKKAPNGEVLSRASKEVLKRFKQGLIPIIAMEIERKLGKKADFKAPEAAFLVDFAEKTLFLRLSPVFVYGRYLKFSREIAQTDFFCVKCGGEGCWYCKNTGFFSKNSVEQILSKASAQRFSALGAIIHGAGREDLDVLMLGNGRPFILEIIAPQKRTLSPAELKKFEEQINKENKGKVEVRALAFCSEGDVAPLKDFAHEKIYSALVSCPSEPELKLLPINEKIFVSQKNPSRVKRRAKIERKKEVVILRAEKAGEGLFRVELSCSHGTYVKEFISGDGGKTSPSLSSLLGVLCSCKELDVIKICE